MRSVLLLMTTLVLFGCGQPAPEDEPILVEDVPPKLMEIAKEKLPDVEFEQALRRADGSYEVRGKDKQGKVRDIDLTATGEVIEIE